jgi:hypothetical protein
MYKESCWYVQVEEMKETSRRTDVSERLALWCRLHREMSDASWNLEDEMCQHDENIKYHEE